MEGRTMSSRTLFADDYAATTLEAENGLLRYVRTATPHPTIERMRAHFAEVRRVVNAVELDDLVLLLDVRAAPPRNDEAFEAEVGKIIAALLGRFQAHAFLVKTAVGNLQVRRLSATGGSSANHVFTDEASALAFLMQHRAAVDR
jgi:hypothetical protein